jgi:DNA polymerase-4
MNRRIIHVDLDAFFVSVEQVIDPELRGKPVVVGGDPQRRGVVASASYEARAFGLHAGMPLITASRLCPQAIFVEGGFPRYRDASARFMSILADFSPYLEPAGLDEAYLDVSDVPSHQVAPEIKHRLIHELGLTASIGIAGCKVVAKVASDVSKPDGLLEVAPGAERLFLDPLPIARLPCVGSKTERVLRGMGVTIIGELATLPPSRLKHHFGAAGETIHRYANGIDDRKVEPPAAAKSISRETTFSQDTRDRQFLGATLGYLSERVGAELRQQGKQFRCITLKLRYASFETITRSHTLREASAADQVIFQEGLHLLERALAHTRQRVRLIGIGVSSLVGQERQLHMLNASAERLAQLNRAIDHIRQKYGFTAIQTGRTLSLREAFPDDKRGYILQTPSLSR